MISTAADHLLSHTDTLRSPGPDVPIPFTHRFQAIQLYDRPGRRSTYPDTVTSWLDPSLEESQRDCSSDWRLNGAATGLRQLMLVLTAYSLTRLVGSQERNCHSIPLQTQVSHKTTRSGNLISSTTRSSCCKTPQDPSNDPAFPHHGASSIDILSSDQNCTTRITQNGGHCGNTDWRQRTQSSEMTISQTTRGITSVKGGSSAKWLTCACHRTAEIQHHHLT